MLRTRVTAMKPVCRILVSLVFSFASFPYSIVTRALLTRAILRLRGHAPVNRQPPRKQESTRGNTTTARIWPQLQPELAELIAGFLPRNEMSTLRLVNKAAASQFSKVQHKTIKLSLPVPRHVFLYRWGGPAATRQLTLEERIKLLCLTAASGILENLKLLYSRAEFAVCTTEVFAAAAEAGRLCICRWLRRVECPWGEDVVEAAARAGQLAICKWLIKEGCPSQLRRLLTVAAEAGHRDVCEWLLEFGAPLGGRGPRAAARAGHASLMERLLQPLTCQQVGVPKLLAAVAKGCDLPTLQRVYCTFVESGRGDVVVGVGRLGEAAAARVIAAAAGSPTPDWQAKVEWLRSRGYPRDASACESAVDNLAAAAGLSNNTLAYFQPKFSLGHDRLAWLHQQHGFPVDPWVACAAGRHGDVAALQLVLDAGVELHDGRAAYLAAERGHLAILHTLHAHGCTLAADELSEAAARGAHVATVEWLVETLAAPLTGRLFSAAAQSGNMEMMSWLRRHGCSAEASTFAWSAWVGCPEQLEWLAANGCPMGDDGEPYLWAGYNGDYSVLECLRRLGCPWSADGATFTRAVCLAGDEEPGHSGDMGWCCSLEVLQWLVSEGCPVDWPAAEKVVRMRREGEDELIEWIVEQRRKFAAAGGAVQEERYGGPGTAERCQASIAEAVVPLEGQPPL
ncbi:hypothetical protein Vafri_20460 [Volvox africanus]|uniref:Uncharacterized protein n=1 Tax=Volvox africanus TaxID=51714 RepID=A0A8J4F9K2_9CHLO|nr:hypothetical protein Vafri_20460 [Volvox africanus]